MANFDLNFEDMDILNFLTDEDDEIFKTIDWGAINKAEVDTCTHAIEQSLHPDGKIDDHLKVCLNTYNNKNKINNKFIFFIAKHLTTAIITNHKLDPKILYFRARLQSGLNPQQVLT